MAKRRLTSRQKRQRTRKIRNRVILTLALLSLASAAMAPELRAYLTAKIHSGVQAFADLRTSEIDLVLPEKKIALLQLACLTTGRARRVSVRGWPDWACHAPSGRMRACG